MLERIREKPLLVAVGVAATVSVAVSAIGWVRTAFLCGCAWLRGCLPGVPFVPFPWGQEERKNRSRFWAHHKAPFSLHNALCQHISPFVFVCCTPQVTFVNNLNAYKHKWRERDRRSKRATLKGKRPPEEPYQTWCREFCDDWDGEDLVVALEASCFPKGGSYVALKMNPKPLKKEDKVRSISFAGGGFRTISYVGQVRTACQCIRENRVIGAFHLFRLGVVVVLLLACCCLLGAARLA